VAHLLDTALRKLPLARNHWYVEAVALRSPKDLVKLVNRLNAEGVSVQSQRSDRPYGGSLQTTRYLSRSTRAPQSVNAHTLDAKAFDESG
jgi:hypothetical protein